MAPDDGWQTANRETPCPVCGHADWCRIGRLRVNCMRIENGKPVKNGGWLHKREGVTAIEPAERKPVRRRKSDIELAAEWMPRMKARYTNQVESIERLASILGVSKAALDLLRVGYDSAERAWWFPERSHNGLVVGVNRRFEDGKKMCAIGSKRALTYCDDWAEYNGPVLIVEGGSDVAAGLTLGLCVVGRPSNTGGVDYLVRLLARTERSRRVVVVGERDRKDHATLSEIIQARHDERCHGCAACWPGKYGAMHVAEQLRHRMGRRVRWLLLPGNAKDLRGWLNKQQVDPNDADTCYKIGHRLAWRLA